jgi:carbon storage regulator
MIGDNVEVKVLQVKDNQVKIGIDAPKDVPVHRREVYLAIQQENENAAAPADLADISQLITPSS